MSNEVVRQFFKNYLLIREEGFDSFIREQSKLFSPDLITIASDTRGTFTYYGIEGFFEGMVAWSKYFFVSGQSFHEYLEKAPTHVLVRMHGELKLLEPIHGTNVSKEDQHDWTQEFELSGNLITKVTVRLSFQSPDKSRS
ncbi:hypothetical protein [Terriglobus saanensis]|uniref:SnoaL-like domain-containing protein n=1 Tax=Terriglobus saanensis (strain ATCC BAA-1853 / DSM 23119 / SP1PR4) TaxID=401053 RepID=E8UZR6_TERSS|nr:hypothetical protein [Terriglobus saanensis]ADV84409.1 hypothetical protein AciPR4_3657 [Terriglobus saanensis SP1PR4]